MRGVQTPGLDSADRPTPEDASGGHDRCRRRCRLRCRLCERRSGNRERDPSATRVRADSRESSPDESRAIRRAGEWPPPPQCAEAEGRYRSVQPWVVRCHWRWPRSLSPLLRLKAAADDAVAIARWYVDPGFRIAIELRGSSTRVVAGRGAVVLAGLRDAVALLRLERGGRRDRLLCGERDGCDDGRGQRGCDQIASVHAYLPNELRRRLSTTELPTSAANGVFGEAGRKVTMAG